MKNYFEFVQLGDDRQCSENGLGSEWAYMLGWQDATLKKLLDKHNYKVLKAQGPYDTWNARPECRTSFKLSLLF